MERRITAAVLVALLLVLAFPWRAGAEGRTLRWGSTGSDVCLAQRKLRAWGYYDGALDCIYGPRMYAAVILFQERNGLMVDGLVGPATWAGLGYSVTPAGGSSRTSTRPGDLEMLARLVSAEAKGESYEGQVAVAAVILNRVRDSRFPNTVAGVVYQPDAFEPVLNGTVYQTPTDTSWRAAQDALNGWDPSGGALFFWNPDTAVSRWVWSRPIIKRIGNHVFAR